MQNGYRNGHATASGRGPTTLLLVEADAQRAERMERHLTRTCPGLVSTRCETLAAARAYLAGTAFDAICTADELPDGTGAALLDVRDGLGLRAPVFVWSRTDGLQPVSRRASAAACFVLDAADEAEAAAAIGRVLGAGGGPAGLGEGPASVMLEALRLEAGAVAHAISNPLTVIAGNAQFLSEMARIGELDPICARPVEDIEAAAQQLSEALTRLSVLRQRIAASLGVLDGI